MTVERDLDFRVAAWLDDVATAHVPEGLLERSLSRVAATGQRPGWLVRDVRPVGGSGAARLRVVALAAAVVVLMAIWLAAVGSGPSPTPTPSPTPAGRPLPTSLRATWVGPTRTPPPGVSGVVQAALNLSIERLQFYGGGAESILTSAATWLGDDRIEFRLSRDEAGCRRDDVGTYAFSLNATSRALTLRAESDTCLARSTLVSGDWTRADCPNRNSLCLGDLDPGQHASAQFNPFVPRDAYVYDYGRLTYTVPEGWSNPVDGPAGFTLVAQAAPQGGAINLFQTAIADSQASDCPGTPEPGVGRTAVALSTWLSTLPGVISTTPTPVAVGGLRGYTLDVSIKPSWTHTCSYSQGVPMVAMFTNGLPGDNNFDWGLAAPGKARLFLLDLPDGRTTLADIEAPDETTWNAFVDAATPIVNSFEFHRP
jgi:hypothetical protein